MLVREVRIRGFRTARAVRFAPGAVCALVGGPSVGKSNVLEAVWTLLRHGDAAESDLARADAPIHLSATLANGDEVALDASPPAPASSSGGPVPVLFLPASLRSEALVAGAPVSGPVERGARAALVAASAPAASAASSAGRLITGLERLVEEPEHGLVLLIEEPELFLRPQAQRYLYRLLRTFALRGNQVLYSTHAPAFLNVGRMDELALVEHSPAHGTVITQPEPLPADEGFRAVSELDAERAELLLASAVLLVEGRTEKLSFPFIFRALGYDADREAISIIDCGGKPNIPLFIRICHAAKVPCVAIHDRDAPLGRRPRHAERLLNAEILALAGAARTVELAPDLEGVAGLRGVRHKPARAWAQFSGARREKVPAALAEAVERVVRLARG